MFRKMPLSLSLSTLSHVPCFLAAPSVSPPSPPQFYDRNLSTSPPHPSFKVCFSLRSMGEIHNILIRRLRIE